MNKFKAFLSIPVCLLLLSSSAENDSYVTVKPAEYNHGMRNPLKGFTSLGIGDHPWATIAQQDF